MKKTKGKREGLLESKPPDILQKLMWLKQHGKKHWKLILCGIFLLILWTFVLPIFVAKIFILMKAILF
jgi:hypothetical protein